jgi:hypothetical protein
VLTITKRSGKEETFQPRKILNSMKNAGVGQETAEGIASCICFREGMTTSEVRNRVIGGIQSREPQSAIRFESHPRKNYAT